MGDQNHIGESLRAYMQAFSPAVRHMVETGENHPVSSDQVTSALGVDTITGLAEKMGMSLGDMASQLSSMLPGLINHLTPTDQASAGSLVYAGDLTGMLGGLLQKR